MRVCVHFDRTVRRVSGCSLYWAGWRPPLLQPACKRHASRCQPIKAEEEASHGQPQGTQAGQGQHPKRSTRPGWTGGKVMQGGLFRPVQISRSVPSWPVSIHTGVVHLFQLQQQ